MIESFESEKNVEKDPGKRAYLLLLPVFPATIVAGQNYFPEKELLKQCDRIELF